MFSFEGLWLRRTESIKETFRAESAAAARREQEHDAAVAVQSGFRGFVVRKELETRNESAIKIQSVVRRGASRTERAQRQAAELSRMEQALYDAAATQIQRLFRGFWSRRHLHDFGKRKAYLNRLAETSERTRAEQDAHHAEQVRQSADQAALALATKFVKAAERSHHLLGTKHVAGVFASPYYAPPVSPFGDTVEDSIRDAFRHSLRAGAWPKAHMTSPETNFRVRDHIVDEPEPLPPPSHVMLTGYGPFKPREAVLKQRARPTVRTLRRMQPYGLLERRQQEEARLSKLLRVSDQEFVSTVGPVALPVIASVHADDKYRPRLRIARRDEPEKNVSSVPFLRVVRPSSELDRDIGSAYNNRVT